MDHDPFDNEYNLDALKLVRPPGQSFAMYVPPRYQQRFQTQEYERLTAGLLSRVLRRHRLFVDVGAHCGFYTLLAATQDPQLEIIALEPVPENSAVLRRNLKYAGVSNAQLLEVAAGDANGRATFCVSVASDNCGFAPHPAAPTLRQIEVPTTRLDTLLAEHAPCPTLIKIDVEGAELAVLRGLEGALTRYPDLTLIVEFNPKLLKVAGLAPDELLTELDRLGFAMFFLDDENAQPYRLKPGTDWSAWMTPESYTNLYCVRKERALAVCLFSHSSHLRGAEQSLLQLVRELVADHGAVCAVVVPGEGPLVAAVEQAGAACIPADYGWWAVPPPEQPPPAGLAELVPDFQRVLRDILPAVARFDPDVLWTQTLVVPWGAVVAALLSKTHVWSVCEYGELDHGLRFLAPFDQITETILTSSALVYTATQDVGKVLFPTAGPDRCRVLYRHIDVPASKGPVTAGLFRCPGALRLGVFAAIHGNKGQDDAVRALAELVRTGLNVELLLAGDKDPNTWRALEALVNDNGLSDRVCAPGFLVDRFGAMQEADVILVPSRVEAFGRVGVEAMLLGKPIVYAAIGGMAEYMVDGQTGLAYVPGDAVGMAAAIRRLADPAERKRLGTAALDYARQKFTPESYGGEVFHRLLGLRNQHPSPALPRLLEPLLQPALRGLASEAYQTHHLLRQLQQGLTKQTERANELERLFQEQHTQAEALRLALNERSAEVEGLRRDVSRLTVPPRFPRVRAFVSKQKRSVRKRRDELRDLLLRGAVRLHWKPSLRQLRRQLKLIRQSQLLEETWYRNMYPELVNSKTDPVLHYLQRGAAMGCYPNPHFDTRWYLQQNPDVAEAGINPLIHYFQAGWREGRQPNPHFHPRLYLEANPDVASAGIEPLFHYLHAGAGEHRPLEPSGTLVFSREPEDNTGWETPDVKLLAFYLPQFHCIPENDTWWGKGFTEWTNVRRGKALFPDHYQPHVPHPSVGYYDLTDPAVMERQAEMARRFGIHGFCFHHYWFGGKRLLEMPLERLLQTGKPNFPFCLCWANENWTRRWDGHDDEVLIAQQHSPEDDENFIQDVVRFLRDRRYIRVGGRPLLLIYRPLLLPDPAATFQRWRSACRAKGLGELYLAGVQGFGFRDPRSLGLDAAIEFPPNAAVLGGLSGAEHGVGREFQGRLYDYEQLKLKVQSRRREEYQMFRGVMPSWDNTARRGTQASLFVGSNPQSYYLWLAHMVRETRAEAKPDERLVFINAWNEWAEGCHLEPDERYGFAWLNATRRALLPAGANVPAPVVPYAQSSKDQAAPVLVISHDACRAGAQNLLLSLLREWRKTQPFPIRLLLAGDGALRAEFEALCPTLVLLRHWSAAQRRTALQAFLHPRPRLVYSNTVVNGLLLEELNWLDCPVVTHVHELQKSIERWAPGETMAATLRRTDHFIAVSQPVAENLRNRHQVRPEQISIISAFIETGWGRNQAVQEQRYKELGLASDEIAVMGCGTTDWRKGPDLFVEIAAKACAREPRLRFFWVGGRSPDEQRGLEKLVATRKLRHRVQFLGERANARGYLALGDVFLLSSREDPFPLAALEAADSGLPIICFEGAGGMPEFVGQECGRVIPFEDIDRAADALAELARDAALRQTLGSQARTKVGQRHSTAAAAPAISALLQQLAGAPKTAVPSNPSEQPLVTIIVPNYNHARFLPERLASIRSQQVASLEILLLDDASQDGSRTLLEQFVQTEPRARLLANDSNSGSTFKQWKKALGIARGKYIWLAESDDSAHPALLQTLLGVLEARSDLALAYAQSRMLDADGKDLGLPLGWTDDISADRWRADYRVAGRAELELALSIKNTIPNASAVLFRNFQGIADLVDDTMRLCADWLFWVSLCEKGGVGFVARPLNYWRQNTSHARTRPPGVLEWEEGRRVIERAVKLLGLGPHETERRLKAFEQRCRGWLAQTQSEPVLSLTSS
ncbi:MAG TPA: FkbM family methyltransferase [Verrucomicrobiae bacterium]|nr:FkbM family methyltransferase [Verrucomicrobiae bacterium]